MTWRSINQPGAPQIQWSYTYTVRDAMCDQTVRRLRTNFRTVETLQFDSVCYRVMRRVRDVSGTREFLQKSIQEWKICSEKSNFCFFCSFFSRLLKFANTLTFRRSTYVLKFLSSIEFENREEEKKEPVKPSTFLLHGIGTFCNLSLSSSPEIFRDFVKTRSRQWNTETHVDLTRRFVYPGHGVTLSQHSIVVFPYTLTLISPHVIHHVVKDSSDRSIRFILHPGMSTLNNFVIAKDHYP